MSAAGFVLAAGAIAAANEVLFLPMEGQGSPAANFNWRLIPATGILAVTLTGLEKAAPQFGTALGMLVLLAVLVIPAGNAPSPAENLADIVSNGKLGAKAPVPVKVPAPLTAPQARGGHSI